MNPIALAKKHPIIATVIVVVVVGVVMLFSGGGGTVPVETESGEVDNSAQIAMQQMQMAYAAKALEVGAARDVALNENATRLTLAQLTKDVTLAELDRSYTYRTAALEAEERQQTLVSTLQAALQEKQVAANAETTAAMFANIKSQQEAAVALAQIQAASAAQLAEINSRPRGLLSWLFG